MRPQPSTPRRRARPHAPARPHGQQRGRAEGLPRWRAGSGDHLQPDRQDAAPAVRYADRGDGARARRADRLWQSRRCMAGRGAGQGRALHRLVAPPARQAPDRLCDRRCHLSHPHLPQDAGEAAQNRARRLARRRDGAHRRSSNYRNDPEDAWKRVASPAASRCARPPEGAGGMARNRGARQEHPARPHRQGRDAGRPRLTRRAIRTISARCAGFPPRGRTTTSARG
jgi:hypothetical protein